MGDSSTRKPARAYRWARSASPSRRARARAPRTSEDTAWARPCSSLANHETVTPAIEASSSRRNPVARRRSAGKPKSAASTRARRERRNSPSSAARIPSKVVLPMPPLTGAPTSSTEARSCDERSDARESRMQSENPGRDVQRVGTARFLGEEPSKIHHPVWGVIGNLGDSQCYLGVQAKVAAVHAAMSKRIGDDDLPVRLVAPAF